MTRREWLATMAVLGAGCASGAGGRSYRRIVESAAGPVAAGALGVTLMHEHVLVDFIGADQVSRSRYDVDRAFNSVLPHVERARNLGCQTIVECTPAYLGRDPVLLERLSKASGVHMLTNTGYYGAANDRYVPRHAWAETAQQLARRWTREFERGIDGTAIKPAFMKIGVDTAPLSEIDAKLVQAAARTHRETALPIASHTGTGAAAMEELDILERAGVPPTAFIWVHAQSERDTAFHVKAARRGAWVEFDGISPASVTRHVELVEHMNEQNLLGRVLVSQDAGWYRVGEPGGGEFRPYDTLFTAFVPALRAAGLDAAAVRQLLVVNPRRALSGDP